jgi:large subunit ribosomal protein L11
MAQFCKEFNEKTKNMTKEVPIPVQLSAFNNRTFTFQVKTPPTSWLIKRSIGLEKGAARSLFERYKSLCHIIHRPGHDVVGKIHVKQIYEIALIKKRDPAMKDVQLERICRCVVGSCLSMGIQVVNTVVPNA